MISRLRTVFFPASLRFLKFISVHPIILQNLYKLTFDSKGTTTRIGQFTKTMVGKCQSRQERHRVVIKRRKTLTRDEKKKREKKNNDDVKQKVGRHVRVPATLASGISLSLSVGGRSWKLWGCINTLLSDLRYI